MYSLSKKIFAEILGTFVLVFFGCGTAVVTGCSVDNPAAYLLTALAFGLSVMAMAYAVGKVSGGHFNPAVTVGFIIKGQIDFLEGLIYIISQCLGALLAGGALYLILGSETGLGTNALYNNNVGSSIIIECILTCVFVLVILSITDGIVNQQIAGLIIGLTLTLVHILGIAFTGTSVNPARSLGVALFVGGAPLHDLWVFIVAPVLGAIIAGIIYKLCIELSTPVLDSNDTVNLSNNTEDTLTEGDKREAMLEESFVDEEDLGGLTKKAEEETAEVIEEVKEVPEEVKEEINEEINKTEGVKEELGKEEEEVNSVEKEGKEKIQEEVAKAEEKVEANVEEVKESVEDIKSIVKEDVTEVAKEVKKESTKK